MKSDHKVLLGLLLLYFLVRIPLLLTPLGLAADDWNFVVADMQRGAIAVEFLDGMRLSLWDYVSDPYGLGSIFNAALTVPFFGLFGKTLFAVKLAPFFWQLLSLVAWFYVFRRYFPPVAVFCMLLFLVIPPPQPLKYTLFNVGFHFDAIFWVAVSLLVFQRFLDGKMRERKAGFCLGLLGGFSSALILSNLVTVVVLWIYFALLQNPPFRKVRFYTTYLPAFLIGFSPFLFYNASMGWQESLWFLEGLLSGRMHEGHFLSNIHQFIRHDLRHFFGFHLLPVFPMHLFMEGYCLIYMWALFSLLRNKVKKIVSLGNGLDVEVFGLLFQILLIGLIVVTDRHIRGHYLFLALPFIGMTLVIAIGRLDFRLRMVLGIFLVMAGVTGFFSLIRWDWLGQTRFMPGYSYNQLNIFLAMNWRQNPSKYRERFQKLLKGQPFSVQRYLFLNMPEEALKFQKSGNGSEPLLFIQQVEESFRPILYEKWGILLGETEGPDVERMETLLKQSGLDSQWHSFVYRGVVQGVLKREENWDVLVHDAARFCSGLKPVSQKTCYNGLGWMLNETYYEEMAKELETENRVAYLWGHGEQVFDDLTQPNPKDIRRFYFSLDDTEKKAFVQGLLQGMDREDDPYIHRMCHRGLQWMDPDWKQHL